MIEGIYYAKAAAFLGASLAIGLGTFGPALGMGLIASKACENMGKYPESATKIRGAMVFGLVLVEAAAVYALVMSLFLMNAGRGLS